MCSAVFFRGADGNATPAVTAGLHDAGAGQECDLTDPFYGGACPTCTIRIIPGMLGLLIGDTEAARTFFIMGPRGAQFDNATAVKWDSDAIEVVGKHIFFNRFMIVKAKINGAGLDKGAYRILVGPCEGSITWAFNNTRHCLTSNCLDTIVACQSDAECTAWLACMQECGDDQMLCPTVCGAFYQSPAISAFTQCGIDNGCIKVDFSSLPPCNLPEATPAAVGTIDGFWWVSAIQGHEYVLYDDCQRFIFKELSPTQISVENSTYVTYKDETRVVKNIGKFTRTTSGYLELIYENWAGYYEHYYPFYVSSNAMVFHVCSANADNAGHDYGTLILTRVPLASLDTQDMAGLQAALQSIFQTTLDDFRLIGTTDCQNGPE